MAETPHIEVVADVLHKLKNELRLIKGLQVGPALLSDLAGELVGAGEGAEEGGGAVDARHDGLGQAALLKVMCRDLPDWGVGASGGAGLGAGGEGPGAGRQGGAGGGGGGLTAL